MSDCQRISCDTTALLKIPNSIPNNNKSSIIYLFSKCTTVRFVSMKEHRQKLFTHTHILMFLCTLLKQCHIRGSFRLVVTWALKDASWAFMVLYDPTAKPCSSLKKLDYGPGWKLGGSGNQENRWQPKVIEVDNSDVLILFN